MNRFQDYELLRSNTLTFARVSAVSFAILIMASATTVAQDNAQTGVVVTINNTSPANGTFQTPIWVGFHRGQFDIYDRDAPAFMLPIPGSVALERLAEDGNTGPISEDFDRVVRNGVQGTILSNTPDRPPLGPRERVSRLFRVDPKRARFFSYASMVIPSNDAFVANGNPRAHRMFRANGKFVGESFDVLGSEVLDAGTEVNDELPMNTAFFGQSEPNTGVDEGGVVVLHPGFLPTGSGGILDDPMFANADFLQDDFRNLLFRFQEINVNRANFFSGLLTTGQEVDEPDVDRIPFGVGVLRTNRRNTRLDYVIVVRGLSGRPTAAHFHVGLARRNGPVVADLLDAGNIIGFQGQFFLFGSINADDVVGPLANGEAPFDNLIAELATRGIYINVHTARNPAGELRGQLFFGR